MSIGGIFGKFAAQGQEAMKYKAEYEEYSQSQLKTEYNRLRNASSTEARLRRAALASIMKDRGYIQ